MINLTIDGVSIRAPRGEKILWAALDNGIYIPNLCAIREMQPPFGACRLCFVGIEGRSEPVTACSEPVEEGMVVYTNTPKVLRLRRTAFELIIADHPIECRSCPKNRSCELQKIAAFLKLKLRKGERLREFPSKSLPIDDSHPLFTFNPNMCILCGKCVWVCQRHGGALNFSFRASETIISTCGNIPLINTRCDSCGECVSVCPVAALVPKTTESRPNAEHLLMSEALNPRTENDKET
jgi:bidirectional [NiFe] hydrogenase diaphorase subunit